MHCFMYNDHMFILTHDILSAIIRIKHNRIHSIQNVLFRNIIDIQTVHKLQK